MPRKEKSKGRIARESVLPVWNWLAQTVAPEAVNKYALGVKTAVLSLRADKIKQHALEFWPVAGARDRRSTR